MDENAFASLLGYAALKVWPHLPRDAQEQLFAAAVNDGVIGNSLAVFLQDVAGETRAGHAEGMADRDRAAVDVVLLGVDAELVARIQALASEGFVQLPEIDVVDLEAMALQQFWHGVDRADAHLVGF